MYERIIRKTKIEKRLIVSFMILSILPLVIISYYSYHKSSEAIQSKTSTYSTEILQLLQQKIRAETKSYENFADEISLNAGVQNGIISQALMAVCKNDKRNILHRIRQAN